MGRHRPGDTLVVGKMLLPTLAPNILRNTSSNLVVDVFRLLVMVNAVRFSSGASTMAVTVCSRGPRRAHRADVTDAAMPLLNALHNAPARSLQSSSFSHPCSSLTQQLGVCVRYLAMREPVNTDFPPTFAARSPNDLRKICTRSADPLPLGTPQWHVHL